MSDAQLRALIAKRESALMRLQRDADARDRLGKFLLAVDRQILARAEASIVAELRRRGRPFRCGSLLFEADGTLLIVGPVRKARNGTG